MYTLISVIYAGVPATNARGGTLLSVQRDIYLGARRSAPRSNGHTRQM